VLDPSTHALRFISGGQGPILHWHADDRRFTRHRPQSFPLGAMPLARACAASTLTFRPGDALLLLSDGLFEAHAPSGEAFGEDRVEAIAALHASEPTPRLASALLDALQVFVDGQPPEDDLTLVLVKREAVRSTSERSFERRLDALESIFGFTASVLGEGGDALRAAVDFALEELFTNIVKYGRGKAPVSIRIEAIDDGVEVTLEEPDAEPFDVTRAPAVDIHAPIEQREPGGLGLHLIPKLVEDLSYTYDSASRRSRTRFRKTRRARPESDVR